MKNKEENILFMLATQESGAPIIFVGIPEGAWDDMKAGKTKGFDLSKAGANVQVILFAGQDEAAVKKIIMDGASASGIAVNDKTGHDFSIKEPTTH